MALPMVPKLRLSNPSTQAASKGGRVLTGAGDDVGQATIVRTISHGEKIDGVVTEAARLTRTLDREHALVSLVDGRRVLVRGGADGIDFSSLEFAGSLGTHIHSVVCPDRVRRICYL